MEEQKLFVYMTSIGKFMGTPMQDVAKSPVGEGFDVAIAEWAELQIIPFMTDDGSPATTTNIGVGNGELFLRRSEIVGVYVASKELTNTFKMYQAQIARAASKIELPPATEKTTQSGIIIS